MIQYGPDPTSGTWNFSVPTPLAQVIAPMGVLQELPVLVGSARWRYMGVGPPAAMAA